MECYYNMMSTCKYCAMRPYAWCHNRAKIPIIIGLIRTFSSYPNLMQAISANIYRNLITGAEQHFGTIEETIIEHNQHRVHIFCQNKWLKYSGSVNFSWQTKSNRKIPPLKTEQSEWNCTWHLGVLFVIEMWSADVQSLLKVFQSIVKCTQLTIELSSIEHTRRNNGGRFACMW